MRGVSLHDINILKYTAHRNAGCTVIMQQVFKFLLTVNTNKLKSTQTQEETSQSLYQLYNSRHRGYWWYGYCISKYSNTVFIYRTLHHKWFSCRVTNEVLKYANTNTSVSPTTFWNHIFIFYFSLLPHWIDWPVTGQPGCDTVPHDCCPNQSIS